MDSSNYLGASPAYGIFQRQVLAGDGSTTLYDLDYTVSTSTQLLVSIDGVIQEPEYSYSITFGSSTSKINFSEAPDNGSRIFITYMGRQLLTSTTALSSPHIDAADSTKSHPADFIGNGSTTEFTLTRTPSVAGAVNMIVFVGGTFQVFGASNDYTVSGETLTFNSAPANSAKITAIQLAESNNVIDTVTDGSITNTKLSLSNNGIPTSKIDFTYSTASNSLLSPSDFNGSNQTTILTGHSADSILVFYNGVCLLPGGNTSTNDYSVAGTTLTLHFTPVANSNIMVRYLPV